MQDSYNNCCEISGKNKLKLNSVNFGKRIYQLPNTRRHEILLYLKPNKDPYLDLAPESWEKVLGSLKKRGYSGEDILKGITGKGLNRIIPNELFGDLMHEYLHFIGDKRYRIK